MTLSSIRMTRALILLAFAAAWPVMTFAQSEEKAASGLRLDRGRAFLTLNLDYGSAKKENVASLFEDLNYSNEKDGSILLGGGWFFKENAAVGLGLSLGRSSLSKEVPNFIGPPTVTDSRTRLLKVAPFIRYYLPMGGGHRFYLLNQLEIEYTHESGDETETTGSDSSLSELTKNSYGLVFTPGLVAIIVRGFALEVTVGVGGVKYAVEKRQLDGEPAGVIKTADFDLRIDILKLSLGFSYYF